MDDPTSGRPHGDLAVVPSIRRYLDALTGGMIRGGVRTALTLVGLVSALPTMAQSGGKRPPKRPDGQREGRPLRQRVERTITLKADPERVFDLIADLSATPKWNPMIESVEEAEGEGIGRTARWTGYLQGERISGQHVQTVFERGRVYETRCGEERSRASIVGRFELAPADGGTTVTASLAYSLPGAARVFLNAPGVEKFMDQQLETALRNLEQLAA